MIDLLDAVIMDAVIMDPLRSVSTANSVHGARRSERSKGMFRQVERLKPCIPTNLLLAL